ncbi:MULTISPECIES: hypothetical protein [Pantoea]|mgnify:FL=1|jgi:hypothetical protein|uniref:Uncharacterized protein n=2 Tax=root TaxID=1 RepID=A0A7Y6NFZ6_9GAMM|nr:MULTISPECIES: hypothetical protein [Pantoea]MBZ6396585.1 hypothetical protein [Pantoea sp.]MBZ6438340.1 hypothetical protein [Pantoea sp.]NUY42816.1 hypothetical protein [Pantoea brenneri]NUY50381.1 hypothetical protein [Pantoea brenneri]NUY60715.1 hypothetical protein [Pantoea brenneri]
MSNYYVSGCVADGDDVSICDDSVAQFWTLYHRNEEGLSEGIIDCMFREDAETAMRVYEHRDALAASFDELAKAVGWSVEQCEQTGESPMDVAVSLVNLVSELENDASTACQLEKLAGAMLNRTLDSGSKQTLAYAECADMVAKFANQLRAGKDGE